MRILLRKRPLRGRLCVGPGDCGWEKPMPHEGEAARASDPNASEAEAALRMRAHALIDALAPNVLAAMVPVLDKHAKRSNAGARPERRPSGYTGESAWSLSGPFLLFPQVVCKAINAIFLAISTNFGTILKSETTTPVKSAFLF